MITLYISLLNFNGADDTKNCLASLNKLQIHKDVDLHVIVVDNGSKDVLKLNTALYNNLSLTLLRNDVNKGFSGGHNDAMSYALAEHADYLMLLNNDTTVHPSLVTELLATITTDKTIGAVVPKIYFTKDQEYHHDRYQESERGKVLWYAGGSIDWDNVLGKHRGVDEVDHGQYDNVESTEFATGCCLLLRKEVLDTVGMFDTRYFLYFEDADLCMRITAAGFRIMFAPKGVVWHDNAKSGGGSGSVLQDYFTTRNRLLFGFTYASSRTKFALLRESGRLLINGRTWQKRGITDFFLRKFGKGSFA